MVKRQTDTDSFTLTEPAGSGTGSLVATAVVAAAVGAGVALLFAPEKGAKTRKRLGKRMRKLELSRQFDELELGKRAAKVGSGAAGGWKQFRKESARRLDPDRGGSMNKLSTRCSARWPARRPRCCWPPTAVPARASGWAASCGT